MGSWNMVPILPWVCRAAHLNETEALKTFNMGLGMILAVAPQKAEEVALLLADAGEEDLHRWPGRPWRRQSGLSR